VVDSRIPLVTVVIATRGVNQVFHRALLSVLNQTHKNIEIIIVYEKLPEIPENIDLQSKTIKLHPQQEKGIYENFNYGIALASGDYICILNDDDWYEQEFVETSVKKIEESLSDGSYADTKIHTDAGIMYHVDAKENLKRMLYLDFIGAYHTTFMIRRTVFLSVGSFLVKNYDGSRLKYASDYDWFIRALHFKFEFVKNQDVFGNFSLGGASSQHRLELIKEAECISLHHATGFLQIKVVKIVWKLRYLVNFTKALRKSMFQIEP
jgi:glycosyltransferase involved in cell wall biosynthesis